MRTIIEMKSARRFSSLVLLVLALPQIAGAAKDPLIGTWKAVDSDGTTSIIEVYIEEESMSARIAQVRDKDGNPLNPKCAWCSGDLENQPVVGMRFVWGLRKQGTRWVDGKVMNLRPGLGQGVIASCELEMSGERTRITGRWGPFSGSDRWERYAASE